WAPHVTPRGVPAMLCWSRQLSAKVRYLVEEGMGDHRLPGDSRRDSPQDVCAGAAEDRVEVRLDIKWLAIFCAGHWRRGGVDTVAEHRERRSTRLDQPFM